MDPAAFTLTNFAFPVGPTDLPAFTLAGFQWLTQIMPGVPDVTFNVPLVIRDFSVPLVTRSFDVPPVG
jgi:hypothetical protein